ncbi:MAG: transposase [Parachlamydiales bacterium]|nr:transposase [Parachlamydiales bacterium]
MKHYQNDNWNQYNKSLINRGSITFWFFEDAIKQWLSSKNREHIGRPFVYSDAAISCAWTIRFVYQLLSYERLKKLFLY